VAPASAEVGCSGIAERASACPMRMARTQIATSSLRRPVGRPPDVASSHLPGRLGSVFGLVLGDAEEVEQLPRCGSCAYVLMGPRASVARISLTENWPNSEAPMSAARLAAVAGRGPLMPIRGLGMVVTSDGCATRSCRALAVRCYRFAGRGRSSAQAPVSRRPTHRPGT
jgi:hypothetical protein